MKHICGSDSYHALTSRALAGSPARGQAVLEMAVVIPLLALLLAAAIAFGPMIYVRLAVQQAAYDCALSAAQSLDGSRGSYQGAEAARQSFTMFSLQPGRADIHVYGDWERGGAVICDVSYHIAAGAFPFHGLVPIPDTLSHSIELPAQANKSEWR